MEKYYLDESDYTEKIPSIMECYTGDYPTVVDRYFTRHYVNILNDDGENEDHILLFHSNRLCLVGIAKSHVAFSKGIASINYNIGNCDRSQNQVKGKHKKGGMNLQPSTTIALINCKDGSEYKVISGITGKLLEVNNRIENELTKLSVDGEGYIAVILCKPENIDKIKSTLTPQDEYTPSCPP